MRRESLPEKLLVAHRFTEAMSAAAGLRSRPGVAPRATADGFGTA